MMHLSRHRIAAACFLAGIFGSTLIAGAPKYDARTIPEGIDRGANAVIRTYTTTFVIDKVESGTLSVVYAVTIFGPSQRGLGGISLYYDEFRTIRELQGTLFDGTGNKLRSLEDDDIRDFSAIDDNSLYDDARVKRASLVHDQYPYTVEYMYELDYASTLSWPHWYAQTSRIPVEHTRFEVVTPEKYDLRTWCSKDSVTPVLSVNGGRKTYVWEARNLPLLQEEETLEDVEDRTTVVRIAAHTIRLGKSHGTMNSWLEFGAWYNTLLVGRDKIPAAILQDFGGVISPEDTDREKVSKLYRYMQQKTRYVSIQLGVGGWQPFQASFVHDRGYGDCKALANYMIALLRAANIPAYPVLIRNGYYRYPMIEEFPSNQFNHMIVCVPMAGDSLWLECTSQTFPSGFVGGSNENRPALLVTPSGGVVVHLPGSKPDANLQRTVATVSLNSKGLAEGHISSASTGNQSEHTRSRLYQATVEERERWVEEFLQIPHPRVHELNIEGLDETKGVLKTTILIAPTKFAAPAGTRLFFKPHLIDHSFTIPPKVDQRTSPIRYKYAFRDIDSVRYNIPAGYRLETLPKTVSLATPFGSFRSETTADNDSTLTCTRLMEITETSIPAEQYDAYRAFLQEIQRADKTQIVLIRKEEN